MELERLCVEQLGGGPWFFDERLTDSRVQPLPEPNPDTPPYMRFRVQRIGSMRFYSEKAKDFRGEDRGPLYVAGESWEDCAAHLGLLLPTEASS